MQAWYANPGKVDEGFLAQMRAEAATISVHTLNAVARTASATDLRQSNAAIASDALVIWGSSDPFFDQSHQQELTQSLRHVQFCPLEGLGHNPHWEEPEKIAALIHRFLTARSE